MYSPNGEQIVSGSYDCRVRLWDVESGALRHTLEGHKEAVTSVVYSPSREQIASGSEDCMVRLWEVSSGQCLKVIHGFISSVISVAWKVTSKGEYLAGGSADKSVRQWKVEKDAEGYKVKLCWSSGHDELNVRDTLIDGVQGLSGVNERLLKQRGAIERRVG